MRGSKLEGGQSREKRGNLGKERASERKVVLAVVLAVTGPDKYCRELLIVIPHTSYGGSSLGLYLPRSGT